MGSIFCRPPGGRIRLERNAETRLVRQDSDRSRRLVGARDRIGVINRRVFPDQSNSWKAIKEAVRDEETTRARGNRSSWRHRHALARSHARSDWTIVMSGLANPRGLTFE